MSASFIHTYRQFPSWEGIKGWVKMSKQLLIIIIICLTYSCQAQENTKLEPKLENIAWIAGTWHGEAFGGITEEILEQTFRRFYDGQFQTNS